MTKTREIKRRVSVKGNVRKNGREKSEGDFSLSLSIFLSINYGYSIATLQEQSLHGQVLSLSLS